MQKPGDSQQKPEKPGDSHGFAEHTYIRRRGRLTSAQARALANDTPRYLLELADLPQLTPSATTPIGMEIGFGMGNALLDWAQRAPDWRLLGVDLYQPGIGTLSAGLSRHNIVNVNIITHPAQLVLRQLPTASIQQIHIYFPDPWPKKRHLRRRLIQPEFVTELGRVMADNSRVFLATDWQPYAAWMRKCLFASVHLVCIQDTVRSAATTPHSALRQPTKFERRGERLGHDICDLVYQRLPRQP